jgi:hypothetical protein
VVSLCNSSNQYLVPNRHRAFELPTTYALNLHHTSYEIVTDYTGFAKIKSICGLISATLDNNVTGETFTLTIDAVFYDSDPTADYDYDDKNVLPPPSLTPLAVAPVTINVQWGKYEIAAKWLANLQWIIPSRTRYVGFRWAAAEPQLFFEDLTTLNGEIPPGPHRFGNGIYGTMIWFRSGIGATWQLGDSQKLFPFSIEVIPMVTCGDNMTMDTEQCDGGIMCNPDCTCPFHYVNDNWDETAWSPLGCECPDAVQLDPHWFVGPPSMNVTRSGDYLTLGVFLPQARPSRWTATAGLAKWDGQRSTNPAHNWELTHYPCFFYGENTVLITDLFKFFDYHLIEHDSFYELDFAVSAHWWERVVLGREKIDGYVHPVDRTMTATLVVGLLVDRTVGVNSTIYILDPNIIWAYVAKSFLYLIDGDFYVDLEIVTRVKSENITINKANFWAIGKDPKTQAIMWVENLTSINGPIQDPLVQYWKFRVHLNEDPCTTNWQDNYTLSYELISLRMDENINPHRETFFLTISKFEDWCGVTAEVDGLEGVQRTYLDVDLHKPATRFWPNDTVVVGVEVTSKYGLDIENVTLVSSRLSGTGLLSGGMVIYNITSGWVHPWFQTVDLYGVSSNCTGKTGCYSFVLPEDEVVYNKPVTIYSVVHFAASGGVKRSITIQQTQTFSRFSTVPPTVAATDETGPVRPRPAAQTVGQKLSLSTSFYAALGFIVVVPLVALIVVAFLSRSRV